GPPPPATKSSPFAFGVVVQKFSDPGAAAAPQERFHGTSGIYPFADSWVPPVFAMFQKVDWFPASSKSVPPTATLNGVEASPSTVRPCEADVCPRPPSHSAGPLSPAETLAVVPCAAACCQTAFINAFPAAPFKLSQAPKLTLITGARLLSTMYSADRSTPSAA